MSRKAKNHRSLIVFLLFLILIIGTLSYQNAQDYSKLQQAFKEEKQELSNDLNDVIEDYQSVIDRKHHLSQTLKDELKNLILLRDTIINLKESGYSSIKYYRKKIYQLEEVNKKLFIHLDSLYTQNNVLIEENEDVKEVLGEKEKENNILTRKNKYLKTTKAKLERKIARVASIKTSSLDVTAMKKKSSGRHTTTSRSSRTDGFRINFDLLENTIVDSGLVPICIQITNEEGKVVADKGSTELKNGKKIHYSDAFLAQYFNKEIEVTSFIKVERDSIHKGTYTIKVFINDVLSQEEQLKLR